MISRRNKFPGLPGEELPLDLPTVKTSQRFDPEQYRAFGSVPSMLGSRFRTLRFDQLETHAWDRTDPEVLDIGLFGVKGGTAYNGLVLGAEFHEALIRHQDRFLGSIDAKTTAANQLGTD